MTLLIYIIVALVNVFLHILRSILVIKSGRLIASTANCICYTFSAVVIKFIAEFDLWIAICVQATTNFIGCYLAMWVAEKITNKSKL
jgi:ABC-type multidrug transport system permease subunit